MFSLQFIAVQMANGSFSYSTCLHHGCEYDYIWHR